MLDLDAVFIIMTLARDGSLARASRTLGLPRSTLTRRVGLLEETLGVRLVERGHRHLRLTEAGRLLVQQGAPLVDAARQVEAELQEGSQGRLRVGIPPGLGWDILEPVFRLDGDTPTDLALDLVYTDRELHPVRDDFDLVVSFAPPTDGSLYSRTLERFSWRCFASKAYLAAQGTPGRAAELSAHSCIAFRTHGAASPFLWPLRDGGALRVNPWFVSTSLHAVFQMIFAGRGIGLVPDFPHDSTRHLVEVLPGEIAADGEVFLSMGQRLSDSPRGLQVKALIEKARRPMSRPNNPTQV